MHLTAQSPMSRRVKASLIVGAIVAVGIVVIGVAALPTIVHRVAIAQLHAATGRPVAIDRVDLGLLTGHLTIHGLRVREPDGAAPFADFGQIDVRVRLPALLLGHLWIRDAVISDSTVRVVRLDTNEFNFSDLLRSSGPAKRRSDVTVDRFVLTRGKVVLEDRALPQSKMWTSEGIELEAHNVSTRRDDGTAVGRSVTAGAPVSVKVDHLRLYPVHLLATVTVDGLDATLARVYLPPTFPAWLDRGRITTSVTVALDARDGLRADATARLEDVALLSPDGRQPLAVVPALNAQLTGLGLRDGALRLERFAADGTMNVRDPTAKPDAPLKVSRVRASIADLTWPATTAGQLDVLTSIPGGGTLTVSGTVSPPPAASHLRLRLANLDLAPWAHVLPIAGRVGGLADADLRMDEPLAAGVPARVQGTIGANRVAVSDARQQIVGARRIEASGLEVHWPTHVVVGRLLVKEPRGLLERDADGDFPAKDLLARPEPAATTPPKASARAHSEAPARADAAQSPSLRVEVGEVDVQNGALAWRDQAMSPPVRLDLQGIDGRVTGVGWPLRGPADVRVAMRTPSGGRLSLAGRFGLTPISADLRVTSKDVQLTPYRPYLPTRAQVSGFADLDVAVAVPSLEERRATVRGTATLSHVNVRDEIRTVMRVERAAATSIDAAWPERIAVRRLALSRPWLVVERDEKGELPLRALLVPPSPSGAPRGAVAGSASERGTSASTASNASADATAGTKGKSAGDVGGASGTSNGGAPSASPASDAGEDSQQTADGQDTGAAGMTVTIDRVTVEDGGMRVVDRAVSPAFAVDVQAVSLQVDDLSTVPGQAARVQLTGRPGPASELTLRGTVSALNGPLGADVNAEIRDFAVPRTNPYLVKQVGWQTTAGRLTTKLRCRIDDKGLSARTDVRVSQLHLVRATAEDGAQARIGLPLGMLTTLMKDKRGDITLSFPIAGSLSDPRFDFSEAIWSSIRKVAVNAITLPVSWIGRVHYTSDQRIDSIEINPVAFDPGAPTPTPEGREQAVRLAGFLDRLPAVTMALTPVVSSRDVEEIKRRRVDARLDRAAKGAGVTREAAAARAFHERFPGRPEPETIDATMTALVEAEPVPSADLSELTARRVDAVRSIVKEAGIQPDRLKTLPLAQREEGSSRIELSIQEQPTTESPSKVRELLQRLGAPFKRSGEE
jgi:uncharacterized protein DUF748